jgi:hypothetical protein
MAILHGGRVLLSGEPLGLVAGLSGRVFRRFVERERLEALKQELPVISTRWLAGRILVHVLAGGGAPAGCEPAEPTLEDVYFAAIAGRLDPAPAEAPAPEGSAP